MADNGVSTLAPERPIESLPLESQIPSLSSDRQALFDSIAQDNSLPLEGGESSTLKSFFAGLLWFGYAIAIGVALVLVWSAASGLLKPLPR